MTRRFADLEALSRTVAVELAALIAATPGPFRLSLCGGRTPKRLYQLLGSEYRDKIDWGRVHLYWGDDFYVPHDHPRSDFLMAKQAWLDHVPLPAANIHPMPTHFADPAEAAQALEADLREQFGDVAVPRFELMLLGLGEDGHTASLFPGSAALGETARWVVPAEGVGEFKQRLTMTLPVMNNAQRVWFLLAGQEKLPVLEAVQAGEGRYPAALVRNPQTTYWFAESY